jgi:alpha,alpha-trehalose phosphorylase
MKADRCRTVARDAYAALAHSTKASGLTLAAAMDHIIDGPPGMEVRSESLDDLARVTATADVAPRRPLRLVKFLAYGWSSQRSVPAIRAQVATALAAARHTGWQRLLDEQRIYLNEFWQRADVELEGDAELQQAVRFALSHTLQASARGEQRAIASRPVPRTLARETPPQPSGRAPKRRTPRNRVGSIDRRAA